MALRTYRLSYVLKITLFILLLSSYRLEAQEDSKSINTRLEDHETEPASFHRERGEQERRVPHVFLAVLVRNSAHMLTNFFGCVENLDYPKESMTVWYVSSLIFYSIDLCQLK